MIEFNEDEMMSLRDSVWGTVTGQNRSGGLYIDMEVADDSEDGFTTVPAFSYWYAPVERGTKVLCSIKKWAVDDKRISVRIDSVDYDREMAA